MPTLDELLRYWFEPLTEPKWFERDPEFDASLRRFEPLVAAAAAGRLDAGTPEGALGVCLALDQLPRNLYRGTPRAFATDAHARAAAEAAVAAGLDRPLPPKARHFVYLPFEHSEHLPDQDRAVELIGALGEPEWLDYAERHRAIVGRFGRFPHRNAILGRASTPEEVAFLAGPNSSF